MKSLNSRASFALRDCVAMHEWLNVVISSRARDLAFSATFEDKISRLRLEMTIATQSLRVEEKTNPLPSLENIGKLSKRAVSHLLQTGPIDINS
jgi:hypothetical protein